MEVMDLEIDTFLKLSMSGGPWNIFLSPRHRVPHAEGSLFRKVRKHF